MTVWFGARRPPWYLHALTPIYALLRRIDAARQRDAAQRNGPLRVPVIVLGNFTVGGTGKTPLCIAIVEHLRQQGWRPGVLSRGYGRTDTASRRVSAGSTAQDVGDEPLLIFKRTLEHVQVDADRLRGAQALLQGGCDVIVADDALQHLTLPRDIEIEVSDARGYGNGHLLPAGPMREMPRSCDLRVRTTTDQASSSSEGTFAMELRIVEARRLSGPQRKPLSDFQGRRVHALAGIGHPQRFFDALRAQGLQVIEHPLPDHHALRASDLPRDGLPVLMTEKDAVKTDASSDLGMDTWVVPAEALLPPTFWQALQTRLDAARARRRQSAPSS